MKSEKTPNNFYKVQLKMIIESGTENNYSLIDFCLDNDMIIINKWIDSNADKKHQEKKFKELAKWDIVFVHCWKIFVWICEIIDNTLLQRKLDKDGSLRNVFWKKMESYFKKNNYKSIISLINKYDNSCYYGKKVNWIVSWRKMLWDEFDKSIWIRSTIFRINKEEWIKFIKEKIKNVKK